MHLTMCLVGAFYSFQVQFICYYFPGELISFLFKAEEPKFKYLAQHIQSSFNSTVAFHWTCYTHSISALECILLPKSNGLSLCPPHIQNMFLRQYCFSFYYSLTLIMCILFKIHFETVSFYLDSSYTVLPFFFFNFLSFCSSGKRNVTMYMTSLRCGTGRSFKKYI